MNKPIQARVALALCCLMLLGACGDKANPTKPTVASGQVPVTMAQAAPNTR